LKAKVGNAKYGSGGRPLGSDAVGEAPPGNVAAAGAERLQIA
jgi:hypothetical protein